MSSSQLFKVAGAIFLVLPIGHTQMLYETLLPGLKPLGETMAPYAAKVSWNQANGYFLTTALLCFKWAQSGIDLKNGIERYIFATLIATQGTAGLAYARKGARPPAVIYWTVSLLMGIAALKQQ